MEKKPCPVDRGKLLIGLECCLVSPAPLNVCSRYCPYGRDTECTETVRHDALSYIYYLEDQLNAKADGSE